MVKLVDPEGNIEAITNPQMFAGFEDKRRDRVRLDNGTVVLSNVSEGDLMTKKGVQRKT